MTMQDSFIKLDKIKNLFSYQPMGAKIERFLNLLNLSLIINY